MELSDSSNLPPSASSMAPTPISGTPTPLATAHRRARELSQLQCRRCRYFQKLLNKYFSDELWKDSELSKVFDRKRPCYFNTGVTVTDLVDGPFTRKIENSMEIPKEKRIYELGSLPPFWCSAETWKRFTTDGTSTVAASGFSDFAALEREREVVDAAGFGNALPCRSSLGPLRPLQTPSSHLQDLHLLQHHHHQQTHQQFFMF